MYAFEEKEERYSIIYVRKKKEKKSEYICIHIHTFFCFFVSFEKVAHHFFFKYNRNKNSLAFIPGKKAMHRPTMCDVLLCAHVQTQLTNTTLKSRKPHFRQKKKKKKTSFLLSLSLCLRVEKRIIISIIIV